MPPLKWRVRALWALFLLASAVALGYLINMAAAHRAAITLELFQLSPLFGLALLPSVALLACHAWWTLGYRRGSLLLGLAAAVGMAFELGGMNWGWLFGGAYAYRESAPSLLGVPLLVPLFWAAFIYAGYSVVSYFTARYAGGRSVPRLLLAVLLDGVAVVAIDLVMDPLQVSSGHWAWAEPGAYFGVPPANFLGWFAVTVLVTGACRALEYLRPRQRLACGSAGLIPVVGYCLLGGGLTLLAWRSGLAALALIGLVAMLIPALFWLGARFTARTWQVPPAAT